MCNQSNCINNTHFLCICGVKTYGGLCGYCELLLCYCHAELINGVCPACYPELFNFCINCNNIFNVEVRNICPICDPSNTTALFCSINCDTIDCILCHENYVD